MALPPGSKIEEQLSWKETGEPAWAQFELSDGTKVKLRIVLYGARRLDTVDQDTGEPTYNFDIQLSSQISATAEMKLAYKNRKTSGQN